MMLDITPRYCFGGLLLHLPPPPPHQCQVFSFPHLAPSCNVRLLLSYVCLQVSLSDPTPGQDPIQVATHLFVHIHRFCRTDPSSESPAQGLGRSSHLTQLLPQAEMLSQAAPNTFLFQVLHATLKNGFAINTFLKKSQLP